MRNDRGAGASGWVLAGEEFTVVAAEEEGEAVQVGAECVQAVGGVADVGQEGRARTAGSAASQPLMSWRVSASSMASVVSRQVRGMTGFPVRSAGRCGCGRGGRSRCRSR